MALSGYVFNPPIYSGSFRCIGGGRAPFAVQRARPVTNLGMEWKEFDNPFSSPYSPVGSQNDAETKVLQNVELRDWIRNWVHPLLWRYTVLSPTE